MMASYIVASNQGWQYPAYNEQNQSPTNHTYLSRPRVLQTTKPQVEQLPMTIMPAQSYQTYQTNFRNTVNTAKPLGRYSRKVFIGGLPQDIYEDEIYGVFNRFGPLTVSWPQKGENKQYYPPRGYAFLIFQEEESVHHLIDACIQQHTQLFLSVSSHSQKNKLAQIRPWSLDDAEYVLDSASVLDPRKTVFVGGVPRPLKAMELAWIMNNIFKNVCCAGIDTDPDLKYPKGAARVTFSNHESYIKAIEKRFVDLQVSAESPKRVELKPFVLDGQRCDECFDGSKCAPFFCASVSCLKYFCEFCWSRIHANESKVYHKPVVKEWADRPRTLAYRRC